MKLGNTLQIEEYDKFPELIKLWNTWQEKTAIMSTGNCNTPEWESLIDYTKEHKKETAEFVYDYITMIGGGWSILSLFDDTFGNLIESDGYIDPHRADVLDIYKIFCCAYMNLKD